MGLESIKIRLPWEKEDTMEKVQYLVWEKKPPTAITNKIVHRQLLQSLFNMQLPTWVYVHDPHLKS